MLNSTKFYEESLRKLEQRNIASIFMGVVQSTTNTTNKEMKGGDEISPSRSFLGGIQNKNAWKAEK